MDKNTPIDFPLASTYGELLTVLNQAEVVRYVAGMSPYSLTWP